MTTGSFPGDGSRDHESRQEGTDVVSLGADDIMDLRRRVLRRGTPVTHAHYAEDEDPDVVHLGIVREGRVVGTSTWLMRPCPGMPGSSAMQLKGMAVEDDLQGRGMGRMLLDGGFALARDRGATVVWARARDSALGFYENCGFEVVGSAFIDDITGLSHHIVVRRVASTQ